MNIVKEFEDHNFFCLDKISHPNFHQYFSWYWGLSDDGKVYYRCTRFSDPDEWRALEDNGEVAVLISLGTMKKIVKQFGHLVVFT